jgi:hypothetical protein
MSGMVRLRGTPLDTPYLATWPQASHRETVRNPIVKRSRVREEGRSGRRKTGSTRASVFFASATENCEASRVALTIRSPRGATRPSTAHSSANRKAPGDQLAQAAADTEVHLIVPDGADRNRRLEPIVPGTGVHRLVAAATGPGDADPLAVHLGPRAQVIDGPQVLVDLEPREREPDGQEGRGGHALPSVGDKRPSGPTDPALDPEIIQKPGLPTRQDTIVKDGSRVLTSRRRAPLAEWSISHGDRTADRIE